MWVIAGGSILGLIGWGLIKIAAVAALANPRRTWLGIQRFLWLCWILIAGASNYAS